MQNTNKNLIKKKIVNSKQSIRHIVIAYNLLDITRQKQKIDPERYADDNVIFHLPAVGPCKKQKEEKKKQCD